MPLHTSTWYDLDNSPFYSLLFSAQLHIFFYLHHLGMFLGRLHLHYQSDTNACASVHCNWPILSSSVHCLCSFGMFLLLVTDKNIITSLSLCVSLKSLNVQVRVMHAIFYFPALDSSYLLFQNFFYRCTTN